MSVTNPADRRLCARPVFPILFGLSVDYEVFLLSRIREEYARIGDNAETVARGLAGTGRVVMSAALIMVAVFLSFVAILTPSLKMLGVGLATAILIDATLVRMVLVPATLGPPGQGELVAADLARPSPAPPDRRDGVPDGRAPDEATKVTNPVTSPVHTADDEELMSR